MKYTNLLEKRLLEDSELRSLKELYLAQKRANEEPKAPDDLFIRPILEYSGGEPYSGSIIYTSPDIWIAGVGVISSDELINNYSMSHDANVELFKNNNIYVRAKNASNRTLEKRVVRLYYCESQYVCWPSYWKPITTDQGADFSPFDNVEAGHIAAAKFGFFWKNVEKPSGGEHYCLIAQIDDEEGKLNPKPAGDIRRVDFAKLLKNGCLWGQRNVNVIDKGNIRSSVSAITTDAVKDRKGEYVIMLSTTDCKGLALEISCSQKDSEGNDIKMSKTEVVDDHGTFAGCTFQLDSNYSALASTYLYVDKLDPNKEPKVNSRFMAVGANSELDEAVKNHLIDFESSICLHESGLRNGGPIPLIALGGIKMIVKK